METLQNTKLSFEDYVIKLATQYANAKHADNKEAHIASKGFAVGYQRAIQEKNVELKELAELLKLIMPAIYHLPIEHVQAIDEFTSKSDLF